MAEWNDDNEQEFVIRTHNRVLRRVNKALRSSHKLTQEYNDLLFKELCGSGTEAELAFEELRLRGGLNCSPQDYPTIVALAVEALQQQRRNSTQ